MTLTKSSQKRLRNEDEESEDVLPSTKRREYFFNRSYHHQCSVDEGSDRAGECHQTQTASTSSAYGGPDIACHILPSQTNPLGEGVASPHLPQNSADITLALHNTHLDRQHYHPKLLTSLPPYHNQQHQQQLSPYQNNHQHHHQQQFPHPVDHPSIVKDAGIAELLPQNSLGPLPDVVHETSEEYYCHVNRLLRSAHFERLKRFEETGHPSSSFSGESHD